MERALISQAEMPPLRRRPEISKVLSFASVATVLAVVAFVLGRLS